MWGKTAPEKSTLVKLLLRFYDADQGAVRVGCVNVIDVDPEDLRNRIGVLFQDYTSYELSVRENVAMGEPDGRNRRRTGDEGSARLREVAGEENAERSGFQGGAAL